MCVLLLWLSPFSLFQLCHGENFTFNAMKVSSTRTKFVNSSGMCWKFFVMNINKGPWWNLFIRSTGNTHWWWCYHHECLFPSTINVFNNVRACNHSVNVPFILVPWWKFHQHGIWWKFHQLVKIIWKFLECDERFVRWTSMRVHDEKFIMGGFPSLYAKRSYYFWNARWTV